MPGYRPIGNRPMLFYAIALLVFGGQLLSLGILAELVTAYNIRPEDTYSIAETSEARGDGSGGCELTSARGGISPPGQAPALTRDNALTAASRASMLGETHSGTPPRPSLPRARPCWIPSPISPRAAPSRDGSWR